MLVVATACFLSHLGTAQSAEFIPLGANTFAEGISGDGSTAVGWGPRSSSDALLWTSSGNMQNLGDLPGACCSNAEAASSTGAVVVGQSKIQGGVSEAFRWTANDGMQGLGMLPGKTHSRASGVSADGSIVVGSSKNSDDEAFRWTEGVGMVGLGMLPGGTRSRAKGVSADGLWVVGDSFEEGPVGSEAFRWNEAGGMQGLGALPGSISGSGANATSPDGSTIVGISDSAQGFQAFRWNEGSGMVGLGILPGGTLSRAYGVSADGSVVVGVSEGGFVETAFMWDETHGMRSVVDVLTAEGLDMTGWQLRLARGVSDDGNAIAGWGFNPSGAEEAWMARLTTIPEPSSTTLLAVAVLAVLPVRRVRRTNS